MHNQMFINLLFISSFPVYHNPDFYVGIMLVGKHNTPTPKGTFKIVEKAINPGGPFGARWLGLNEPYGDYGIHGTNAPGLIGRDVSNGCVRMYNKDVIELSNIVPIGTIVRIM
jgi:lipoprotein-anchoring transpeptidase ErfK/SrfK